MGPFMVPCSHGPEQVQGGGGGPRCALRRRCSRRLRESFARLLRVMRTRKMNETGEGVGVGDNVRAGGCRRVE